MKAFQRVASVVFVGWLWCVAAFAGTPHLVRDINSTIIPVHSDPGEFMDQGSWAFLSASNEQHQRLVWGTDGTPAGTLRLGLNNGLPSNVTGYQTATAGGRSYFISTAEPTGYSLWSSDGTPQGTRLITDHNTLQGGDPGLGWPVGNDFQFTVRRQGLSGFEFWLTNGTAAGTHLVKVMSGMYLAPDAFAIVNDRVYFLAAQMDGILEPWVTDGTSSGTQRLALLPNATEQVGLVRLARVGQYLVFAAPTSDRGNELWRIDLDTNAVTALPDIAPGATSGVNETAIFGLTGNFAVFAASSTGDNAEPALWRTDGVTVSLLANVSPLQVEVDPYYGPTPGGRVFFLGTSAGNVRQVWSTDGTTATRLTSGDGSNGPRIAGVFGSLVALERSGAGGSDVWVTDGTLAGTRPLMTFTNDTYLYGREFAGDGNTLYVREQILTPNVGFNWYVYRCDLLTNARSLIRSYAGTPGHTLTDRLFAFTRGQLYFNSDDPITGNELWVSDGTVAGTSLLKNLAPETHTQSSSPDNFVEFGGKLYFAADDGIHGKELWQSDGTSLGTELVKDLYAGTSSSDPAYPFVSSGKLYFFAKDGFNAYQFYVSDGTATGIQKLAALFPSSATILAPDNCGARSVSLNGVTFFAAYESAAGLELWKTDGTPAGTAMVADINTVSHGSPCSLTVYAGRVYFSATSGVDDGNELWSTDGSAAGTHRVADIRPGFGSSSPRDLVVFNQALYFTATDSTGAPQLWRSDGTPAGTVPVSRFDFASYGTLGDLRVVNGVLLFQVAGKPLSLSNSQLWSSDGTVQGTARVGDITPLSPSLFANNARGYFRSGGPQGRYTDLEPWVTDGTAAGTQLLLDINSFPGSAPDGFTDFRGVTLFLADDGTTGGVKLWRTDGTSAGTRLAADIGQAPINPFTRLTAGQNFFYVSDTDGRGAELYALGNDAPLGGNDAGGSVQAGASLAINVLANDTDADGALDPVSVRIQTPPANGTAVVSSAGLVTYTARAGFAGADSFTYTVDDNQGGRSFPANVNVTVTAAPSTPPPSTPPSTPPTTPPTSSGSGGGGMLGAVELLFLLLVLGAGGRMKVRSVGAVRQHMVLCDRRLDRRGPLECLAHNARHLCLSIYRCRSLLQSILRSRWVSLPGH
ncbi:MAG: ELWxxDGT repeat protein [Gammaproteobacteria bacterium]